MNRLERARKSLATHLVVMSSDKTGVQHQMSAFGESDLNSFKNMHNFKIVEVIDIRKSEETHNG